MISPCLNCADNDRYYGDLPPCAYPCSECEDRKYKRCTEESCKWSYSLCQNKPNNEDITEDITIDVKLSKESLDNIKKILIFTRTELRSQLSAKFIADIDKALQELKLPENMDSE